MIISSMMIVAKAGCFYLLSWAGAAGIDKASGSPAAKIFPAPFLVVFNSQIML